MGSYCRKIIYLLTVLSLDLKNSKINQNKTQKLGIIVEWIQCEERTFARLNEVFPTGLLLISPTNVLFDLIVFVVSIQKPRSQHMNELRVNMRPCSLTAECWVWVNGC